MDRLSAFLVVKTFARLYRDYAGRYALARDVYAMPRTDKGPDDATLRYRGLDRDPLYALHRYAERNLMSEGMSYHLAEVRIAELEAEGHADNMYIAAYEDAIDVCGWIDERERGNYEIIWARVAGSARRVPSGYRFAGFEPSYFPDGCFSASCDCMLFPRWHGTDEGGQLFAPFFRRLNQHGLFETRADAEEFLRYYRSFDWTERGTYQTAEVFLHDEV